MQEIEEGEQLDGRTGKGVTYSNRRRGSGGRGLSSSAAPSTAQGEDGDEVKGLSYEQQVWFGAISLLLVLVSLCWSWSSTAVCERYPHRDPRSSGGGGGWS